MSTLRGMFSLLEDNTISLPQMMEMVLEVLKKLNYTSDFLDTLLFWINSQMDNFNSSARKFSLKEVLDAEIAHYKEQAAQKGVKLVNGLLPGLSAFADPNSVRIVVRNLITNAIKFSEMDDTIEVSSVNQNGSVLMKVSDTGVGMTESQKERLFKSKVDSKSGTQNESGTGMGMLFCKDLVEKCNGKIWVESKHLIGTTFCFTIPVPENTLQVA